MDASSDLSPVRERPASAAASPIGKDLRSLVRDAVHTDEKADTLIAALSAICIETAAELRDCAAADLAGYKEHVLVELMKTVKPGGAKYWGLILDRLFNDVLAPRPSPSREP